MRHLLKASITCVQEAYVFAAVAVARFEEPPPAKTCCTVPGPLQLGLAVARRKAVRPFVVFVTTSSGNGYIGQARPGVSNSQPVITNRVLQA